MANQLLEVWCDYEGFSLLNDGSPAMPSACFGHSAIYFRACLEA